MENLQRILKEIIVVISIIAGTIAIFHVLAIQTNALGSIFKHLPYVLRPPFVFLSPGILVAIVYHKLFTKDIAKILIVSIITIILWIYWFSAIYPALIYD